MDTLNVVPPITIGLQNAGDSHTRRVRIVVILGGLASILFGVPWVAFFAIRGEWTVTGADCAVILGGVIAIRMARRGRLRGASILLVASLFIRLFTLTLFFDIPDAQVPRSIDHFLIPLAVAAYLMLKHENVWLRHSLAWGCLASVIFFSSSHFGLATRLFIPDSVRGPATWVTNSAAMLLLFLLLQIFVADIDRLEARLHRARVRTVALAHLATPSQFDDSLTRFDESVASTIPQNACQISEAETQAWQRTLAGRTRLTILATSSLLMALGSMFGVYFSLEGIWPLALFDGAFVALGLALWILTRYHHQSAATIGMVVGMMLIFIVSAVILDVPTLNVPRSTHYWFLPLSLGAYFLLRDENAWIHNGLPIACLAAFVVLGSSNWAFVTDYIVPDSDRPPPWLNCTCALGVLYFLVYILVGDIKRLEERLGRAVSVLLGHNRVG
ncbi:MAG: hypothetical protein ABI040_07120 [Rhodoferax sp.]